MLQLRGISAAANGITKVDASLFSDKLALKWIDLSSNQLQEANFTSSCSLTQLEEIYLSNNQLTSLPDDAFKATSSLSIFVIDGNKLNTLPACSLTRFYEQMDVFDISNNPLVCDCRLSWLKLPHTIATYRHSECVNLEFTDTDSFSLESCSNKLQCLPVEECSTSGYKFAYSGVMDDLASEYQPSTAASATTQTSPQYLISLFFSFLLLMCSF